MDENSIQAAKQRAAERRQVRDAAALKARQLPSTYQRRLSQEFRKAAEEARTITRGSPNARQR